MSRQRDAGTRFETACKRYLEDNLGVKVRRNSLMGSADEGDLYGIDVDGRPFVIECKAEKAYNVAQWMKELQAEKENAGTDLGAVFFKRRKVGYTDVGKHLVLMDMETFVKLRKGAM